jgi:hypothetical protein
MGVHGAGRGTLQTQTCTKPGFPELHNTLWLPHEHERGRGRLLSSLRDDRIPREKEQVGVERWERAPDGHARSGGPRGVLGGRSWEGDAGGLEAVLSLCLCVSVSLALALALQSPFFAARRRSGGGGEGDTREQQRRRAGGWRNRSQARGARRGGRWKAAGWADEELEEEEKLLGMGK